MGCSISFGKSSRVMAADEGQVKLNEVLYLDLDFPNYFSAEFQISRFVVLRLVSASWVSFLFFMQPNNFVNLDHTVLECQVELGISFSK